jgi:hypothetical protein
VQGKETESGKNYGEEREREESLKRKKLKIDNYSLYVKDLYFPKLSMRK